ncbi:MAG: hypothetical protein DRP78_03490 [Candidatus Omnitrophota bacterium]|nr:MAG: hypothetical protein DRP78_03490 [Candidatus Omnitrophota bacterium]
MIDSGYSDISLSTLDNEVVVKSLVEQYQQRIFALVLYLNGDNFDQAYDITVSSFVKAFSSGCFLKNKSFFLIRLIRAAIKRSRDAKIIPFLDDANFADLPPEKRNSLFMVKKALQTLTFKEKIFLLLRDQFHLCYKDISAILKMPESDVRVQTVCARIHLREKVEEVLNSE